MKRVLLIFFLLSSCFAESIAQGPALPSQCEAFYPEMLMMNSVLSETSIEKFLTDKSFGQGKVPRNKTFWIVYSDRDNNTTFKSPDGREKFKTLEFNQRVRIAQIKNSYALVYDEPMQSIEYPRISQKAECLGWVPMKKLLIWHNCLANDNGIFSKALLCFNLDNARNGIEDGFGQVFKNPSNRSKFEKGTTDLNFYFVMKREGDLSLLARSHTMEGISDKVVLYGWVNEKSYVAWNQRSCLEPTWEKADVEYFTDRNIHIDIFSDKNLKELATRVSYNKRDGDDRDKYLYRMSGWPLRFPLLDDNTSTLYNCTSFGSLNGQYFYDTSEEKTNPNKLAEASLEALANINICLCIDGTSSMEPFYKTVSNAVKEGIRYFAKDDRVKVSAVIYRDHTDGEYAREIFPLTKADNPAFYTFLENGGKYGIRSSAKDRTLEEAMFYGMNEALDKVGFKPEQSNILFVIGDCGNDRDDKEILKESLIEKLFKKKVHLMTFQVNTGNEDAYTLFNHQLMDIVKGSLDKKYNNLMQGMSVKFKEIQDGYNFENVVNSNIYIGSLFFPSSGSGRMDLSKLTTLIHQSLNYCSQSVQHQKDLIAGAVTSNSGFNVNKANVEQKLEDSFIRERIGDDVYDMLKESNSLISFKGYAPRNDKSGRAFFKPVVFISSDELTALIERLAPVNDAAVLKSNNREPYINAMKALVKSMIPDEMPDEKLGKMGYREIMNKVSGLNEASEALKQDYTIEEIASPQIVTLPVYTKMVTDFRFKFQLLKKIAASPYKYTRTVNGVKYFWLPIEDLP